MFRDAHVVVTTDRFGDDFSVLTREIGFRVDAIFPADAPSTAIVSGHGVRLRVESGDRSDPITLHLLTDDRTGSVTLPGGARIEFRPFTTAYALPDNEPALVVTHDTGALGTGRAGMRYRDLIPDRWGGRFIASLISIPGGGPVPDYVHFHKVRFQMIFVKSGWVRVVYEDQGEPILMEAGDCVLQPPEIRHRVLESSPGLEVVEVGCPALHETIADWSLPLPNRVGAPDREWDGQRFVFHDASEATYGAWRMAGWEQRDTGIETATNGLAGVRVARPASPGDGTITAIAHTDGGQWEFELLVCLQGSVEFRVDGEAPVHLVDGSSVAIPGGTGYDLANPTHDCQLLDVTLPAEIAKPS